MNLKWIKMERIIKKENNYVIQEKLLFWWLDKTAEDDNENDLPCVYSFDTLEDAIKYASEDVLFHKTIVEELINIIKENKWQNIPVSTIMENYLK